MSTQQVNRSWSWTACWTCFFSVLRPRRHLLTLLHRGIWAKCSPVWFGSSLQHFCWWLWHILYSMWSGNFQRLKKGKGVANNYASLSNPGLAGVHQIPFMPGLPAAAPVIVSFPGTMVDSCLLPLWCTLSLLRRNPASWFTFYFFHLNPI